MTIKTRSSFIYGLTIDSNNRYIDFNEGASNLVAELNAGSYSLTDFNNEVARALNAVGGLEYVTTLDRATRIITISANANFSLLGLTGSNASRSVLTTIGLLPIDYTGSNSYSGTNKCAKEYRPQMLLQNYTPFEKNKSFASAKVNESASGKVEVISFGSREIMECSIAFITDIDQGDNSPIETDLNAIDNALEFMNYAITKGDMEFQPDRDNTSYTRCLLESARGYKDGTGFKLDEMSGKRLSGYFDLGLLQFRKV